MANYKKKTKAKPALPKKKPVEAQAGSSGILWYLLPVLFFTFLIYIPALQNTFTNWDDVLYVTKNPLLRDLSGNGFKAIFSTPVVSNYHPITILTLALNYSMAELNPWSFHLTSMLLHVINTGLVFVMIMHLSGKNKWVSAATALLFGIHPMHVESVAWISERKDLMYTLFYLGAMIVYIHYLRNKKIALLALVTFLGGISLLCKPAAIVLPLSLLLVDYYLKRKWSWSWIIEKIPLIVLCGIMAYVTVSIQSERAIASVEFHTISERISYAGFGLIWYLLKLIVPYPLSALHPFPKEVPVHYYLATIAAVIGFIYLVWKVRNRNYLFGFGFYLVNLLLVLQLVSIGNAVVAERYTYVPYISLFFLLTLEVYKALESKWSKFKPMVLGIVGLWVAALAIISFLHIPTWKSSETLWINVLKHYPESPRAWTNKALNYYDQKEYQKALDDLSNALKYDPNFANGLEWRSRAYLETGEKAKALDDALKFNRLYPNKTESMFVLAKAYDANKQPEEALKMYNQLIPLAPKVPQYLNNRGVIYFNQLKKYDLAREDIEKAIQLDPNNGSFYLNLSRCYYMLNDVAKAKELALKAKQLGHPVDGAYGRLVGIE